MDGTSRLRADWELSDPALVAYLRDRAATLTSPSKKADAPAVGQQTERHPHAGEARAALVSLRNKLQTSPAPITEDVVYAMDAALGFLELEADEEVYLRLNVRGQCLARHMVMATNASDVERITQLADTLLSKGSALPEAPVAELRKNVMLWSRLKTNAQRQKHALRMFAENDGVRTKAVNTLLTACIAALQTLPPDAFTPVRLAEPAAAPAPLPAAANQEAAAPEVGGHDAAAKGEKPAAGKKDQPAHGGGIRIGRPARVGDDGPAGNGGAPPGPRHQPKGTTLQAGGAPQQQAAEQMLPPRKRAKPIVEEPGSEEEEGPSDGAAGAPKNLAPRDPDIDNACDRCGSYETGTGKDVMLVCDGWNCAAGRHLRCCRPVLSKPPPGDWFCDTCSKWRANGVPAASLAAISKKYGLAAPVWRAMLHAFGEKTGSHNAEWLEARLKRGGLGAAPSRAQMQKPAARRNGAGPASFRAADVSYEGTEDEDGDDDDAVIATLEPEAEMADAGDEDVEPEVDDMVGDYEEDEDFKPTGKAGAPQAQKSRQGKALRKPVFAEPEGCAAPPAAVVAKGPPEPTVGQLTPGRVPKLAFQTSLEFPDDDAEADAEVADVDPEEARRGGNAGGGRGGSAQWTTEELVALGEGFRAYGANWAAILQGSAVLRGSQRQPAELADKYLSLEPGAAGPSGKQAAKKKPAVRRRMFEEEQEEAAAPEAKRQRPGAAAPKRAPLPPPPPPVTQQAPRKTRATQGDPGKREHPKIYPKAWAAMPAMPKLGLTRRK